MHTFVCDLCGQKKEHDPTKRHIPFDWFNRRIKDKVYLLCHQCGNEAHFVGGISPYLKKTIKFRFSIDIGDDE